MCGDRRKWGKRLNNGMLNMRTIELSGVLCWYFIISETVKSKTLNYKFLIKVIFSFSVVGTCASFNHSHGGSNLVLISLKLNDSMKWHVLVNHRACLVILQTWYFLVWLKPTFKILLGHGLVICEFIVSEILKNQC